MNPKLLSFSAAESQTSEGAVGGGWAVWLWPPRLCLVSWPTPPDIRDNSHSYGDTQGRFKGSLPEHSPPFHCSFPGPPSHRGGTPATGSSPRPQRILHSHLMLQPSTTSAGTWYPPPEVPQVPPSLQRWEMESLQSNLDTTPSEHDRCGGSPRPEHPSSSSLPAPRTTHSHTAGWPRVLLRVLWGSVGLWIALICCFNSSAGLLRYSSFQHPLVDTY